MDIPILPSQRRIILPSTITKVNHTWPVVYSKKNHDCTDGNGKILHAPLIVRQAQCLHSSLCSFEVTHPDCCRQTQRGSSKRKSLGSTQPDRKGQLLISLPSIGTAPEKTVPRAWTRDSTVFRMRMYSEVACQEDELESTVFRMCTRLTSVSHMVRIRPSGAFPILWCTGTYFPTAN